MQVKRYGPARGGRTPRRQGDGRGVAGKGRRLISPCLRRINCCFVCGKPHRSNDRHSREEVNATVAKLKEKHPSAPLTVTDLSYITHLCAEDDDDDTDIDDPHAEWAQDDSKYGTAEDGDLAYIAIADLEHI